MLPKWLLIAIVVFLCLIGAFAAGVATYKLGQDNSQPVPGRPSPSASNR